MTVRTAAAVSAIWAVGTWLRLYGLNAMEFKADERISLELAIKLLESRPWASPEPWPTHGLISSNGIGNAPLFTWIVAPLWAMTHHPIGVTALIAVINALCLLPLWFWARRRMDGSRALLTLAIAAVSPFTVLFSRKIWPVDLLFPGLIAVLWSVEWIQEGRYWRALTLGGVGFLAITQLHQSGVVTGPLLLVAVAIQLLVDARRGGIKPLSWPRQSEMVALVLVLAANLFLLWTYLPYLRTLPPDVLSARPVQPDVTPQLLLNAISEVVPRHIRSPFWVERDRFVADGLRWAIYNASLVLGLPLAAYGIWRWLRSPLRLPVVGLWWWMIIVAFAAARIPSHDYYVLAIMPLPIVLASGAFDGALPRALSRGLLVSRWAYVATLLALTVVTGSWLANRGGSQGDYGVTFGIQVSQARALLQRANDSALAHDSAMRAIHELPEAPLDAALARECKDVSWEVIWIGRWIDSRSTIDYRAFEICDAWIPQGSDVEYRWAIRLK